MPILGWFSNCPKLICACINVCVKIKRRELNEFQYWNYTSDYWKVKKFNSCDFFSSANIPTWMLYNCCQFFAHEHQIWHQWMVPKCNSIVCLPIQSHLKGQLHLVKRLDCQYVPLLYHHGNDQPSIHTGIFAVKIVVRTETKKKNMMICEILFIDYAIKINLI